ncbi:MULTISPECIES: BrnA antitoxin family protein [Methylomicrobium]|uniref:BrnA antitoxin of type II toxin-antitoxin system n=1 Tax=Methylomicrobium album BG8 TaxID=686340 RepID=H8GJH4_METAL|nr:MULTISPECIES: BrnA antitoxin family protein [Methylomicrobium]EIC30334.1 hypothetical protein Metal_2621 [Methylomicrobium album BG8]
MKNVSTGKPETVNLTDWDAVSAQTDADITHDSDSPATVPDDWAAAFVCHNAGELHAETTRRKRGANKRPTKEQVAIRFDADVLAAFRATGRGWQTRMNEALKEWLREHAT